MADDDVPIGGSESSPPKDQPTTREVQEEPSKEVRRALPAQPDSKQPEDPYGPEHQVYLTQLKDLDRRAEARDSYVRNVLMPEVDKLQSIVNQPDPAPPQPYAAPAAPTQAQQGGLSEFIANLLKFGALAAIAFGSRGRGGAILSKIAIGSALEGYAKGRREVTEQALQVYEKNRQYVNDLNRQQTQEYHNILADRRLTLSQQMDLINARARVYGDMNTADAARRQDLRAVLEKIEAQRKLQDDTEKEQIRNRDKLYDVLGKTQITAQYLEWLRQVSGGTVTLTGKSDPEEWNRIVAAHPDWSFSSFLKWHHQQELKNVEEIARARREGVEEGKEKEQEQPTQSQEQQRKEVEDKAFRQGLMMPGE